MDKTLEKYRDLLSENIKCYKKNINTEYRKTLTVNTGDRIKIIVESDYVDNLEFSGTVFIGGVMSDKNKLSGHVIPANILGFDESVIYNIWIIEANKSLVNILSTPFLSRGSKKLNTVNVPVFEKRRTRVNFFKLRSNVEGSHIYKTTTGFFHIISLKSLLIEKKKKQKLWYVLPKYYIDNRIRISTI